MSCQCHRPQVPPCPPHAPLCQSRSRVVSHPLPWGLGRHPLSSTPRGVSLPIFECDFKEWKMRLCVFIKKWCLTACCLRLFVPGDHFSVTSAWGLRREDVGNPSFSPWRSGFFCHLPDKQKWPLVHISVMFGMAGGESALQSFLHIKHVSMWLFSHPHCTFWAFDCVWH